MSIGASQPFRPAGTASVIAGTSAATVSLPSGGDLLLVTNAAGTIAFVRLGSDLTVTATTADLPILPGSRVLLGVNSLISTAAVLLASGSGSVFFTRGDGSSI